MSAAEILENINRLSPTEKLFIIEKMFKDLLKNDSLRPMTFAAEALESEYKSNAELTAFSSLDLEDFYEAK